MNKQKKIHLFILLASIFSLINSILGVVGFFLWGLLFKVAALKYTLYLAFFVTETTLGIITFIWTKEFKTNKFWKSTVITFSILNTFILIFILMLIGNYIDAIFIAKNLDSISHLIIVLYTGYIGIFLFNITLSIILFIFDKKTKKVFNDLNTKEENQIL
ncbi:hypothetical protein ACJA27_03480 [Mycoplasmopsis lipophila]|uniref:hypothetical protein n=1 Tax=Mycoplasmopsis lipophila TaxID=2117 RepID=UPI003873BB46